jgi:triacylglycerol lipase
LTHHERRAPIILTHGLLGFARIGFGSWTLAVYFRGIPEYLRLRGYRVYVPRVHPTAGIARRARKLAERIDAAFPGERVHIIGHSMGGLDARELITHPDWSERVLSLTTIGSPHLGSLLAERVFPRIDPVYRILRAVGWDHQGFYDILPECAMRWHEATPAPDHVPCYSVAGDAPSDYVSWPLRRLFQSHTELDGSNDGLVSVRSALAFGQPLPPAPIDHFHQMNWCTGTPGIRVWSPVRRMYRRIVETIEQHDPAAAELVGAGAARTEFE